MTELSPLSLFPLQTALFPGALLPLHVFEPRYHHLVDRCIERRTPFGVTLVIAGSEVGGPATTVDIGTSARIVTILRRDDGSLDLLTVGEARFCIEHVVEAVPYPTVLVRWLRDDPPPADIADVRANVLVLISHYLTLLGQLAPGWKPPPLRGGHAGRRAFVPVSDPLANRAKMAPIPARGAICR